MLLIRIKTDNAAFDEDRDAELARILRIAADKIEHGNDTAELYDINGNPVGEFKITGKCN